MTYIYVYNLSVFGGRVGYSVALACQTMTMHRGTHQLSDAKLLSQQHNVFPARPNWVGRPEQLPWREPTAGLGKIAGIAYGLKLLQSWHGEHHTRRHWEMQHRKT